jgi:hypothetical protein
MVGGLVAEVPVWMRGKLEMSSTYGDEGGRGGDIPCGWDSVVAILLFVVENFWFGEGKGSLVQIPVCLGICSSISHLKGFVDVIIAIELKTIRLFTSSTTNIKNQMRCRCDDSYKNLITLLHMVALANRSDTISNGGAVHVHVFCCEQFERMGGESISQRQDLRGEVQLRDWLRESLL